MPHSQVRLSADEALNLVELAEKAARARTIPELAAAILQGLASLVTATVAVLFLQENPAEENSFFHLGLAADADSAVKAACAERFHQGQAHSGLQTISVPLNPLATARLTLFPLQRQDSTVGLVGLALPEGNIPAAAPLVGRALYLISQSFNNLLDCLEKDKQIANLNAYLNVSSMIAQVLDLRDVLEAVLYFSMEAMSAEAASVLLLDYGKENLRFYSVEGPAKPVLLTATFPADQGLAGCVLQSQQSEVINDVQNDPRFYGKIDKDSGFQTRNMIVIPLTAGEEKIGVLEVLNKVRGEPFTEEERLLLQSIAEEIAFAIRNSKLFEVVVKSYCKQRQGLNTCKGCKRPLGSWTPCVKYREEAGLLT
jgi:GAF domain-containing protein